LPAKLPVEVMRVGGEEDPAAEALEVGVGHNLLHQHFGEAVAAVGDGDEDVAEVGDGGVVGDDAGEADLRGGRVMVDAKAEGVGDGALDGLKRDVEGPVGFFGEEGVDKGDVEFFLAGGDGVVAVGDIDCHGLVLKASSMAAVAICMRGIFFINIKLAIN